ncbi:hypothetical protein KW842_00490 [Duganella sp. sic0402]|uniref:hypothetical protein n=1 Tax=Duganella sp. sic0402 TaxID=2854786 RepID=UPI001C45A507|nr:hypothetical protein [Duganella sp. sic0402]MBV7534231.1 hypothetical protein [Duganella sp. sic0402]
MIKLTRIVNGLFFSFLLIGPSQAASGVSYFPDRDLGRFLSEKFDLATIRSSLGPRRTPAKRTFLDFGMKPSQVTEDSAVFLTPGDWLYELRIVGRGDFNGDGFEDLKVCFIDRALNGGTYNTAEAMLLTRYADAGYVIALRYSVDEGTCPNYAK